MQHCNEAYILKWFFESLQLISKFLYSHLQIFLIFSSLYFEMTRPYFEITPPTTGNKVQVVVDDVYSHHCIFHTWCGFWYNSFRVIWQYLILLLGTMKIHSHGPRWSKYDKVSREIHILNVPLGISFHTDIWLITVVPNVFVTAYMYIHSEIFNPAQYKWIRLKMFELTPGVQWKYIHMIPCDSGILCLPAKYFWRFLFKFLCSLFRSRLKIKLSGKILKGIKSDLKYFK